ncbi:Pyridoxal phosphate homeostasis protein [Desulfovibrionales bacterium]
MTDRVDLVVADGREDIISTSTLLERLARVRENLAAAEQAAGRAAGKVQLLAVSKFCSVRSVAMLARAGQLEFGENYVQEALAKQEGLAGLAAGLPIRWHFIGRLQRNKVRFIAGHFAVVQTVDSFKLAKSLHEHMPSDSPPLPILLQVNVGREPQKFGVAEDDLVVLAEAVVGLTGLALEGLMVLPSYAENPEASRPSFARLRELRENLANRLGRPLPVLSMGMSHDYKVAVEEGATMVRIGTDIFGERPACHVKFPVH